MTCPRAPDAQVFWNNQFSVGVGIKRGKDGVRQSYVVNRPVLEHLLSAHPTIAIGVHAMKYLLGLVRDNPIFDVLCLGYGGIVIRI